MSPRCHGEPRPVYTPVSDRASEKPMLTAAPIAVARPAKNAMWGSSVDSATAKIGASVESEPSISPMSAGCTRERRKACSSSVKRCSLAAPASIPATGFQVGGSSALDVDRQARRAPGLEAAGDVRGVVESEPLEVRGGKTGLVALVAHDDEPPGRVAHAQVARVRGGVAAPLEHVPREEDGAGDDAVAPALQLGADVHEHGAVCHRGSRRSRLEAVELAPDLGQ